MTMREPVVTAPIPFLAYLFGSVIVWLIKATLIAILIIGTFAVLALTSPYWITKRVRKRRART